MCRLFGSGRSSPAVNDDSSCQLPPARCAGCDQPFNANDLVMKVHLFVFHSSCFSCCVCRNRLSRGQQFALVDTGHIYCRADYERRHAGSDLAGPAAHDARRVDVDGGCEDLPCDDDDDVGPAAKTDEDCLSPSSCGLRTYCRRSWRTRKLTPSVHRNGGETKIRPILFYLLSIFLSRWCIVDTRCLCDLETTWLAVWIFARSARLILHRLRADILYWYVTSNPATHPSTLCGTIKRVMIKATGYGGYGLLATYTDGCEVVSSSQTMSLL